MNIINIPLKDKKWVETQTPKTHVIWHASFGRTIYTNGFAKDTLERWNNMGEKYGTPYIVDRDGTIIKTFDDREWIYHLNIPTSRGFYDKKSVGITLANEQQLIRDGSRFYAFEYPSANNHYTGPVFESKWRGYQYWAGFDDAQVDATIQLTLDICKRHNIEPVFYAGDEWNPKVWELATIFTHSVTKREVFDFPLEPKILDKVKAAGIKLAHS